jgi:hypothetical protein
MKKRILFVITLSFTTFIIAQNKPIIFDPNGTKIFLYTDAHYKGKLLIIDAAVYTEMDLTVQANWQNKISSIKIPIGYGLSMCDLDESKGDKVDLFNNDKKPILITDFKKLPTLSFQKWKKDHWDEMYKSQVINFDNKLSYFSVVKNIE